MKDEVEIQVSQSFDKEEVPPIKDEEDKGVEKLLEKTERMPRKMLSRGRHCLRPLWALVQRSALNTK